MIFEEIYNDILRSTGLLWNYKEHGETLEIITPYATTNQKFVSLFLTQRSGNFIVSDGGWINDGIYETEMNMNNECFIKLYYHYLNSYNIKETKHINGRFQYYKINTNRISIASMVFDMANFVSAIVSISDVDYTNEEGEKETKSKELFRGLANSFISGVVGRNQIDFKGYLDTKDRTIRVSAIIKRTSSQLILVNYITGTTPYYFTNSIGRSLLMFEMADKSLYSQNIYKKITLVDDTADGYIPAENFSLDFSLANTKSERIDWSTKEKMMSLLN